MYKSYNERTRAGSARVYMCVIIMYANSSPIDVSAYIDIEHEYDLHVVRKCTTSSVATIFILLHRGTRRHTVGDYIKVQKAVAVVKDVVFQGLAAAVAAACCQAQRVCHHL
jgi:hypothetical protein